MKSTLLALVIAAAVVILTTPLAMRLAFRVGAVSVPGGRHVHERGVPRLGGLAIAMGTLVAFGLVALLDHDVGHVVASEPLVVAGLVGGSIAMCLLGVLDDTRGVKAVHKLAVQVGVALAAYACGFRIDSLHLPLLGDVALGVLAVPVTLVWIVGVVNAVNLIDGLDGLAAGVVLLAAGANLVIAFMSGAAFDALASAALAGAAFGFLFHNFNPARIFMGDSGSYFLGFSLAVIGLRAHKASTAVSLLVPMVALGVPIVDTLFAMVRRILERRSVFSPDRGHIHHRLLDMGITHRRAVLIIYGISVVCTLLAIGMWLERRMEIAATAVATIAVVGGLVRFGGSVRTSITDKRRIERLRSRDTEMLRRTLPSVPFEFGAAQTEDDLLQALTSFCRASELTAVEIERRANGDGPGENLSGEPRFRWSQAPESKRGAVAATFPLGPDARARFAVTFTWQTDDDQAPTQSEILLQVTADILANGLTRVGSALAPEPARPHEPAAEMALVGDRQTPAGSAI